MHALIDSGSLGDFIFSTLVEQLGLKKTELDIPVPVQLAVQGSRSHINFMTCVDLKYQKISEKRSFDIVNLSNYDLILETPFLYQHKISCGINPPCLIISSVLSLPWLALAFKLLLLELLLWGMMRLYEHIMNYLNTYVHCFTWQVILPSLHFVQLIMTFL